MPSTAGPVRKEPLRSLRWWARVPSSRAHPAWLSLNGAREPGEREEPQELRGFVRFGVHPLPAIPPLQGRVTVPCGPTPQCRWRSLRRPLRGLQRSF